VGTRQEDAEGRCRHPGGVRDGAKSRGDVEGSRRLFFRPDNVARFASLARKGMAGRDIAFLCRRAVGRRSILSFIVQYPSFVALLAFRGVLSGRERPL